MLSNHIYNLVLQLTQENKSLWRIKNEYMQDHEGCSKCEEFWKKIQTEKEAHVEELKELLKQHL